MSWAYVENSEIIEVHYFLPRSWKNISNFDVMDVDGLKQLNWYEIEEVVVEYDSNKEEVYDYQIIFEMNTVKRIPLLRYKVVAEENQITEKNVTSQTPENT